MDRSVACILALLTALSGAAFGRGQRPEPAASVRTVDESRDAAPDGTVTIRTYQGSVRVTGWDRSVVKVTGSLGRDIVQLDLSSTTDRTSVEVVPPDRSRVTSTQQLSCELEVKVPAGASVKVSSLSADVTVRDVAGIVECETMGGKIDVAGAPGVLTLRTLNGSIVVAGPAQRVSFQTMGGRGDGREDGGVTIDGDVPEVRGSTLSGDVKVRGATMRDYDISTLSGSILLEGSLAEKGRLKADAGLGGSIALTLPADVQGTFTLDCPWDRVDLEGFSPRAGIEWVFKNEGVGETNIQIIGEEAGGATGQFAVGVETPGRLPEIAELPRIILGGSFSEFDVGTPGSARVYLEIGSLRSRSSESKVMLKTR